MRIVVSTVVIGIALMAGAPAASADVPVPERPDTGSVIDNIAPCIACW